MGVIARISCGTATVTGSALAGTLSTLQEPGIASWHRGEGLRDFPGVALQIRCASRCGVGCGVEATLGGGGASSKPPWRSRSKLRERPMGEHLRPERRLLPGDSETLFSSPSSTSFTR